MVLRAAGQFQGERHCHGTDIRCVGVANNQEDGDSDDRVREYVLQELRLHVIVSTILNVHIVSQGCCRFIFNRTLRNGRRERKDDEAAASGEAAAKNKRKKGRGRG